MKALETPETSVIIYQSSRRNLPADLNLQTLNFLPSWGRIYQSARTCIRAEQQDMSCDCFVKICNKI
jgi:hypothetical protein